MADISKLVPIILKWEGGFVNDPDDKGGATNKGVTLTTFRTFYGREKTVDDLKAITADQWTNIFRTGYWDKMLGDRIINQSVANILVDWAYHSGTGTASKQVQKIVGTAQDGIIGSMTMASINNYPASQLFDKLKEARLLFFDNIVKNNPSQEKFLKGWKNRVNSFNF